VCVFAGCWCPRICRRLVPLWSSLSDGLGIFVWAVLLVQFYRRHEARQAWQWGTYTVPGHLVAVSARTDVRPGFDGVLRVSPVTGRKEKYFSRRQRLVRYLGSAAVTGVLLLGAFCVMICSLNLQGACVRARACVCVCVCVCVPLPMYLVVVLLLPHPAAA
jgi:hypothetical protein